LTKEAEQAFECLKKQLTTSPVLKTPEFKSEFPFEISSDASNICIEGVLQQRNKYGNMQPIGFVSRMLKGAELKYPIIEKEALAIYFTIIFFIPLLTPCDGQVVKGHFSR
jgi:hypothetical protein